MWTDFTERQNVRATLMLFFKWSVWWFKYLKKLNNLNFLFSCQVVAWSVLNKQTSNLWRSYSDNFIRSARSVPSNASISEIDFDRVPRDLFGWHHLVDSFKLVISNTFLVRLIFVHTCVCNSEFITNIYFCRWNFAFNSKSVLNFWEKKKIREKKIRREIFF